MKVRLTVTIDAAPAIRAKRAAQIRKTSVSGVVEESLRAALQGRSGPAKPFGERWVGHFTVVPEDSADRRLAVLKAKHGLE